MNEIKGFAQRCDEHPDHQGIVTQQMVEQRLQEEIAELREYIKQRKPLTPKSPCEMTQAEYKMFKLGWLECEAAHGITKGEV